MSELRSSLEAFANFVRHTRFRPKLERQQKKQNAMQQWRCCEAAEHCIQRVEPHNNLEVPVHNSVCNYTLIIISFWYYIDVVPVQKILERLASE